MPLFSICTSAFNLENIKVERTKLHKGMPISTTERELGAAVRHMDSTTQQLWKNMTNKFAFLMANNILQACLYRLGMPGTEPGFKNVVLSRHFAWPDK